MSNSFTPSTQDQADAMRRIYNGVKHERIASLVTAALVRALNDPQFTSMCTEVDIANLKVLFED